MDSSTIRPFRIGIALALFVAVAGACLAPAVAQQTAGEYQDVREMPPGQLGELVRTLIDVVNSNDPAQVERFVMDHFTPAFRDMAPIEEHQDVFAGVYKSSRGLEFYAVRQYTHPRDENEHVVIVRNKLTDGWQALVIAIDPEEPELIDGLQFAPARPPSDLPAVASLSEAQAVTELRAFVRKMAEAEAFSGTVLLAKNGKVLYEDAVGLASRRYNVPNRLDTKFNLGSMNKMFTGVAVAQLVQQGKLSFDDPVRKYLDASWLSDEAAEGVQVKHLLSHTSGLGSYFNDEFWGASRLRFRVLDDYKPLVRGEERRFAPGKDWGYSNTGMLLAGAIVEKVSGKSYFEYVRENIYKPAGMSNTDCYEMDHPVPNLAIGYTPAQNDDGTKFDNNILLHVVKGGPAGGGFSTVRDLLKFDQALRHFKLLNRELTETVWSAKPDLHSPRYGYGFGIDREAPNRVVGHSGGFVGISARLSMFLDRGYTVAVLANIDNGAPLIANKAHELLDRVSE